MKTDGFSIIEAIVATVILGVLLVAILGPIGGLFKISKSNQQTLNNTTLAQQVAERFVNDWSDPTKFEEGCLDALPTGVIVTVQDLDEAALPTSPPQPLVVPCPGTATASATAPKLRRVHIVADSGGPQAEVVLDLAHPAVTGAGP